VWARFMWLRIESSGGLLSIWWLTVGSYKRRGNFSTTWATISHLRRSLLQGVTPIFMHWKTLERATYSPCLYLSIRRFRSWLVDGRAFMSAHMKYNLAVLDLPSLTRLTRFSYFNRSVRSKDVTKSVNLLIKRKVSFRWMPVQVRSSRPGKITS
jgi:hypothetical protein